MNECFQHVGITYGLVFLVSEVLFFFAGLLVMRLVPSIGKKSNSISYVLNALAIGMTIVVPCFSIIWCKGNSIMWIAILLWAFYFVKLRSSKGIEKESISNVRMILRWDVVIVLLIISLVIYLAFFYAFFIRCAGTFFFDFCFYGNAASYMLKVHSESVSFYGLQPLVSPYHYGELWLSALVAKAFGLKPIYTLVLCAYPLIALLCTLGMASLCKSVAKTSDWVAVIVGFGALSITPLPSFLSDGSLAEVPKFMVMAFPVIWGTAAFLDNNKSFAFIGMLMAVPFYSTITPGILTFCFCFTVFEHSKNGFSWKSVINPYTLMTLCVAMFYSLFYWAQASLPYSDTKEILYDGNWVFNALVFFVKRTGRFVVGIAPTLVLLFFVLRKSDREVRRLWIGVLVCFFISVMMSGIVGGVAKQFSRDGGQIQTNYMVATIVVLYCMAILYICVCACKYMWPSMQEKTRQTILSLFVILLSVASIGRFVYDQRDNMFYPVADRAYNERQYDILKEYFGDTNPVFGSFYLQGQRFFVNEGSFVLMMPNIVTNGYFFPYDLSCLRVPESLPKVLDDSHSRALWQYVQVQKQNGTYISDDQSLVDFIAEMQIEYFLVSDKEEIPGKYRAGARLLFQFEKELVYQIIL